MAAWSAARLASIGKVIGLYSASRATGTIPQSIPAPPRASAPSAAVAKPATIVLATARGRAGYAADRVLFYATAGGAFANVQTNFNGTTTTHTQSGWTAGAGLEWAFADNWTAKVEYLYVNLGNGSVNCATAACLAFAGAPIPVSVGLTENLFRAGVNFKFSF